jgi:TonB family protein
MTMTRRDPTILFALLVALGVHLALIGMGVKVARRDLGWWLQSPPAALNPPPAPPVVQPSDPMQQLGDHNTNGASINSSSGDQPMESAIADARQEQAAVQRDPAGFGGKGANQQLDQTLRGDNGDNAPRGTNSGAHSAASVFGSRESSVADLSPKISTPVPTKTQASGTSTGTENAIDPLSSGPLALTPPKKSSSGQQADVNPSPSDQAANQQTGSQANGASSASGGGAGGTAGAPDPGAGNPIPTSDFESFPVSHIASRFVPGKIEARTGRKMRTRELPRLGLAAVADLENMDRPFVVLMLKIDTTGNVTDAQIKHSSGSDNVDLPCQRAAYTWWFEPLKDPKTGQIHPEEIEFTIYF